MLSLMDIALLFIVPVVDRRLHAEMTKPTSQHFFRNTAYDEPVNRFMLSKGGLFLQALVIVGIAVIAEVSDGTLV